jgi:AraC family transcriptional regulator
MNNHKRGEGEEFLILAPRENDISRITPKPPTLSSFDMGWDNIHFEYHCQPPFRTPPHRFSQHVITIQSAPHPIQFERSLDGASWKGTFNEGSSFIVPEHVEHAAHTFTETEFIVLSLEPPQVNPIAHESVDPDRVEIIPRLQENFDPLIYGIGLGFKREIESNGMYGRLYIDLLTTTLSVHLLHQYSARRNIFKEYVNGLPKYKLRRLIDYIDNHMADNLSLAELASIVGMSQYYFSRLFKQSMGLTPHQYIIQCRVERAKQLLLREDRSIVDIAHTVGFSDQSHLTYHFKRLLGVTPKTVLMENGKNLLKKQESAIP